MKGKIAFVLYRYPLGVSGMIINSVKIFADKGIDVDVYIDKSNLDALPVAFRQENVTIKVYDHTASFLERVLQKVLSRISGTVIPLLVVLLKMADKFNFNTPASLSAVYYIEDYGFINWLRPMLAADYDYIFPVEARSLIVASDSGRKIIYYNMELLDWSEKNPIYGNDKVLLKLLEYKALKDIFGVAIQNEKRAEQFRKINNYNSKMFILPVAAMDAPVISKGSYFREKFAIPENVRIVIYSGNIMPWAKCAEIVDSVRSWPQNYCLVMHTWRSSAFESGYGLEVKERAKGLPVYLSQDYIDFEDMPGCLSSADIALMFYEPIDTNFIEILFSSNKFAEYLKAGLPVICSDFPELKGFIETHGVGRTIAAMDQLPDALSGILTNYDSYRDNVLSCYQNVFRFERYFETLYADLFPPERNCIP